MYCKEKQSKPRKTHRNHPSFSSSLLDEICRSIDGGPPPPTEIPAAAKPRREEPTARLPRPCLADRKTQKSKKSDNTIFPDTDTPFSTSTSAAEFFASVKRPHPIRTAKISDNILFDDYQNYEKKNNLEHQTPKSKSNSKMVKIYAQLKKLSRQPISPGAKLTGLINSFFSKKSSKKEIGDAVDCGGGGRRRSSYDVRKFEMCGRPPLPPNAVRNLPFFGKAEEEDEDEDGASESSSDLFELDHLSLYGRSTERFCEELPVYGTTYFDRNCCLIR